MKRFFKFIKRILKFILIIFLVLLSGSLIFNKCNKKKSDDKNIAKTKSEITNCESLAEITASETNRITKSNKAITQHQTVNIQKTPYFDFEYNFVNSYFEIYLDNVPTQALVPIFYTFEIVITSGNAEKVNLKPVLVEFSWGKRTNLTKRSDEIFSATFIPAKTKYQFIIDYSFVSEPVENITGRAYFYQGVYTAGYSAGIDAGIEYGKNEGYNHGLTDGTQLASYGIFKNATVDLNIDYLSESGGKTLKKNYTNQIPLYISGGLSFQNLYNQYDTLTENNVLYEIESVNLQINLEVPFQYSKYQQFTIFSNAASDVNSIVLIDTSNKRYQGYFDHKNGGMSDFTGSSIDTSAPIKAIQLQFGRAMDTFSQATLTQDNSDFAAGYEYGYNQAISTGAAGSGNSDEAYNKGYSLGMTAGYDKAMAEGITAGGLFNGAISFVKMFFNLSSQFLQTKIVNDITLGLLVIGLPCAFMIVNLAIGLVKKVLGGRGASEGDDS